jgi:ATP-dependent helicase/nuclease subunit A
MSAQGRKQANGPVICVASAGTGKTHWLTEEFFAALKERDFKNAHQLAAITFTENAANEMRSRIRETMLKEMGLKALPLVEELNISTIHSFCRTELARHAAELGLNPAFEVLDEPQAGQMARSALLALLRERHRAVGNSFELLAENLPFHSYFGGSRGTSLEGALLDLYRKLRARGVTTLDAALFEMAELPWGEARSRVSADLKRIESLPVNQVKNEKSREKLAVLRAAISKRKALLQDLQPTEEHARALREVFAACHMGVEKGLKEDLARFKGVKDGDEYRGGSYQFAMQAIAAIAAKPLRDEVISILAELDARLSSQKRAAGVMDFEDLQLEFLRVLHSDEAVRCDYRERFAGVFVDEFQDTNPLQVQIIELMAERRALRYVGDPKQSVYGWRYAEPETIRQRREEFEEIGRVEQLSHNYRSRPEILQFVNTLCAHWGDSLGYEYDDLVPAAEKKPEYGFRENEAPCVEVFLTPVDDDDRDLKAEESRLVMADAVARYLRRMVEEERLHHTSLKRESSPLSYSDFTILLRTNQQVHYYEAALARAGIPFVSETSTGFLDTPEIVAVLGILRTLLMPENDRLLAEALRSDLVGLSSVGLAELAASAPASQYGERQVSFNRALLEGVAFSRDEDAAAVQEFLRWREELVGEMELLTVSDIVEAAILGLRLREKLIARGAPERARWNLEKLLDLALGASSIGIAGVAEFVEMLAETEYQQQNIGEMWLEGPDSVRLMTVHKAKGLTIPAVILAEAGSGGRGGHPLLTVEPSEGNPDKYELGVNHRFLEGSIREPFYQRHLEAEKERSEQEEARLLYVALTRAVEHIAIFGLNPKPLRSVPWRALLAPLADMHGEFAGLVDFPEVAEEDTPADGGETPSLDELISQYTPASGGDAAAAEAEILLAEAETPPDVSQLHQYLFSVHDVMAFAARIEREAKDNASDPAPSADGRELGTAIHDLLAYALRHPEMLHGKASLKELMSDKLLATRFSEHEPVLRRNFAAAERFLTNFKAAGVLERVLAADAVLVETPFLLAEAGVHIRGRFDLLLRAADIVAVLDFKTDSLRGKSAEALTAEYETQMLLYALAARGLHPKADVSAGLVLLDAGEIAWIDVGAERLRALTGETLPQFAQVMRERYAGAYTWRPASWHL